MESGGQSTKQPRLGYIADRVWTWIRAHADIEADDRTEAHELAHACTRHEPALDPHDLRCRSIRSFPDEAERQTRADSGIPELFAESEEITVRHSAGAVDGSLSSGHGPSVARRTCQRLNRLWSDHER